MSCFLITLKNDRPGDDGTLRSVYFLVFLLGVIDLASNLRLISNIFRYEYSLVSYSYHFSDTNILGYSFVLLFSCPEQLNR